MEMPHLFPGSIFQSNFKSTAAIPRMFLYGSMGSELGTRRRVAAQNESPSASLRQVILNVPRVKQLNSLLVCSWIFDENHVWLCRQTYIILLILLYILYII
jgi:hypothetical protein